MTCRRTDGVVYERVPIKNEKLRIKNPTAQVSACKPESVHNQFLIFHSQFLTTQLCVLRSTINRASASALSAQSRRPRRALAEGGTVYSLGDIVHNRIEVQRLEQLGLRTVTHADMPHLAGCRLFIRAHGEPPTTYAAAAGKLGIGVIDATCPVVARLQTPRGEGSRTDAPRRRAGCDPRQTGPRRSGGPHGAGRGPDDRDRTGGGPRS